jgi:hypothetical protein
MAEASTSDERNISSFATATRSVSSSPQTTTRRSLQRFGYLFFRLPPEIRCLIYDCLVAGRVIHVLKDSNDSLGMGCIENLLEVGRTDLQADILKWLKSRKDLVFDPNLGRFDPRTAVFSATFAYVPYLKGRGTMRTMSNLSMKDAMAWDTFSFSEFHVKNVRQIRIDLYRHDIFTGRQSCLESFKADLRSIGNFRSLERLDIDCNTHMYLHDEWKVAQNSDPEPQWSIVQANALLRRIWRNFWRYGGWCHPGRACTCCALPEIRLRGCGTEWQLLEFEPEIPESTLEETTVYGQSLAMRHVRRFDVTFGRDVASVRQWLKRQIKYSKSRHAYDAFYKQKMREMEERRYATRRHRAFRLQDGV